MFVDNILLDQSLPISDGDLMKPSSYSPHQRSVGKERSNTWTVQAGSSCISAVLADIEGVATEHNSPSA